MKIVAVAQIQCIKTDRKWPGLIVQRDTWLGDRKRKRGREEEKVEAQMKSLAFLNPYSAEGLCKSS